MMIETVDRMENGSMDMDASEPRTCQLRHLSPALVVFALWAVTGCAEKPASREHAPTPPTSASRISGVSLSSTRLVQGDEFDISFEVGFGAATRGQLDGLMVSFQVQDVSGRVVAELESDFFTAQPMPKEPRPAPVHTRFRWADLDSTRTGAMTLSHVSLRRYAGADDFETLADQDMAVAFEVVAVPVEDEVRRMFISRGNSLWWLTEMARVDNAMTRRNGLFGCVMFGGFVETWIRNDNLASPGTEGLCYWEITGYAVQQLALEYERTGDVRLLDMARDSAESIVRHVHDGVGAPMLAGSLPTFQHYDGRVGEWYRDQAMLFDHGQILMGLLELARVMDTASPGAASATATASATKDIARYQDAARRVGDFMMRARDSLGGTFPYDVSRVIQEPSAAVAATTKVVTGFKLLYQLTGDERVRQAATAFLNGSLAVATPPRGKDHHGRSYNVYGFIRGFEDFLDPAYLAAARRWFEEVAADMNDDGTLIPEDDYSAIPAQSQVIRNGTALWRLTGDARYLDRAGRSARYLARSSKPWAYRQPVLKLGRFQRQSGGMFNSIDDDILASWASVFHVDAMYEYLGAVHGHVLLGEQRPISMIGPVTMTRLADGVELSLRGHDNDHENGNIGIHVGDRVTIAAVVITGPDDGRRFSYHTAHTARLPPFKGSKTVRITFGDDDTPHVQTTNSHVLQARSDGAALRVRLTGRLGSRGVMDVHWPGARPAILLNGHALEESAWTWEPARRRLALEYRHDGAEQTLEIATTGPGPSRTGRSR